jgi:ABC-type phosphate/phosphonate transport system permease subunit
MEFSLGYAAVAAFYTLMAWVDRAGPPGIRQLLAIAAWPAALVIVLALILVLFANPEKHPDRRYLDVP